MSNWDKITIGEFVEFNPPESLKKGKVAKKIPMEMLTPFERNIKGFEFAEYNGGSKFRNGDVLVAKITPCLENGKTAQVNILEDDEIAFGSTEFIVLRENKNSVSNYIFYLAKSPLFRERAISCMEGTSGRKRVNEGALKRQEILVPDKKQQKQIASILSSLDDKIELNNKINAELEKMAKTLYDYWFVQFDFPDANGKPYQSSGGSMVYNNEVKRKIPEGWEVKSLGEVAEIYKGDLITEKTAKLGNIKVVAGGIDFAYYHSTSNRQKHTITVSGSGANAGFVNFWREEIFASDCTTVRGKSDCETIIFYLFLIQHQNQIYRQAKGSAQPHVYPNDIKALKIVFPTEQIIKNIEESFVSLNSQIEINFQQNQTLASFRDWLLPLLMNGQLTVQEAYKTVAETVSKVAERCQTL